MTLNQLIEEYKQMASVCNNFDCADKKAVKRNNKAVSRMYEIVHAIRKEFGHNGVAEFAKLIDTKQDRVDLWAAIQMLEKMTVDKDTEKRALAIIKEEAKDSLGHQYWLKEYHDKKK